MRNLLASLDGGVQQNGALIGLLAIRMSVLHALLLM